MMGGCGVPSFVCRRVPSSLNPARFGFDLKTDDSLPPLFSTNYYYLPRKRTPPSLLTTVLVVENGFQACSRRLDNLSTERRHYSGLSRQTDGRVREREQPFSSSFLSAIGCYYSILPRGLVTGINNSSCVHKSVREGLMPMML
jgi:hypothetical protein